VPDASYYKGRYYLYFGLTPAVTLLWPYAVLTGREMPTGAAVVIFCCIGFLAGSATWLAFRRRYFPTSPGWMAPLGVLAFGLGTHVLALLSRALWWELAIAGGFCFGMLAIAAAYRAIHCERRATWLCIGALCLGFAVGARPTWFLAVGLLIPPVWLARAEGRAWRPMALAAGLTFGACLVALFAYNYARFGNFLEFGQRYQLSTAYESRLEHFSLRYLPGNLHDYFLKWPAWTWDFPFLRANVIPPHVSGSWGSEGVVGLGSVCPFVWLALAAPAALFGMSKANRRAIAAVLIGLALCFLGIGLPLWCMYLTTPRYMADFSPTLGLLALSGALGIGQVYRIARAPIFAALVWSAISGFLLMFDYNTRFVEFSSPALAQRCESIGRGLFEKAFLKAGLVSGPRVAKVRFNERPTGTVETFWQSDSPQPKERIIVEHLGQRQIRFGYLGAGSDVVWGRELTWVKDHTHTVELQLPTLYGDDPAWLRGFAEWSEFRERSCAVVRFSGDLALATIVEPMGRNATPGGFVPESFSGSIRSIAKRPFGEGEMLPAAMTAPVPRGLPGGSLFLVVRLPLQIAAEGEPLFAGGARGSCDMVFLREVGHKILFEFDHYGGAHRETAGWELDRRTTHQIAIALPSFDAGAFGHDRIGDVSVSVDSLEVMRFRTECYGFDPNLIGIGRNPFGTTCGKEFRGWILDARWRDSDR